MSYRLRLPPSLCLAVPLNNQVEPQAVTAPPPRSAPEQAAGAPPKVHRLPGPIATLPEYVVVTTPEAAAEACRAISGASTLGIDTETYALPGAGPRGALDHSINRVRLLQASVSSNRVAIFDLDALAGLPPPLAAILADQKIRKVCFNARFDAGGLLHHFGVEVANIIDLLAGAILVSGFTRLREKGAHTLQAEVGRWLHQHLPKEEGLSDWSRPHLTAAQLDYAARDAAVLLPLLDRLLAEAERLGLSRAWELENEVVIPVVAMGVIGIAADGSKLTELASAARADAQVQADQARRALARPELNINSPKQIIAAVRQVHGLDLKGTSEEVLKGVAESVPAAAHILASRRAGARATSAETFADAVRPDGRIHASFNPLAAPTGRFGCKEPNLLAVPRDPAFRSCFHAPPGMTFVVADYAAIQLRIIADQIQDRELLRCFCSAAPIDPHTRTAAEMLGKAVQAVTHAERKQAKPVNFGFAFGMGAPRLVDYARDNYGVSLTLDQAVTFRGAYFRLYRSVRDWHRRVAGIAGRTTEVRTASGRLRILQPKPGRPPFTELLNTPIQGTEADGMKRALALLHPRLKEFGARLVNCIHDEVLVEAPVEEAEAVKRVVVEALVAGMSEFVKSVPVLVEACISPTWAKK